MIYTVRGVKVMLDADLAAIYGYETRSFNQQVKNNIEKFDDDFRFHRARHLYAHDCPERRPGDGAEQSLDSKSPIVRFTNQIVDVLLNNPELSF